MTSQNDLEVAPRGEQEIQIRRVFTAPPGVRCSTPIRKRRSFESG